MPIKLPIHKRKRIIGYALISYRDRYLLSHNWIMANYGYVGRLEINEVTGKYHWIFLHREVLGLTKGDGLEADHKNLDKLNCQRSNLRILTRKKHAQNRPSHKNSTSKNAEFILKHGQINGVALCK